MSYLNNITIQQFDDSFLIALTQRRKKTLIKYRTDINEKYEKVKIGPFYTDIFNDEIIFFKDRALFCFFVAWNVIAIEKRLLKEALYEKFKPETPFKYEWDLGAIEIIEDENSPGFSIDWDPSVDGFLVQVRLRMKINILKPEKIRIY